jgi:hypothetical protein
MCEPIDSEDTSLSRLHASERSTAMIICNLQSHRPPRPTTATASGRLPSSDITGNRSLVATSQPKISSSYRERDGFMAIGDGECLLIRDAPKEQFQLMH